MLNGNDTETLQCNNCESIKHLNKAVLNIGTPWTGSVINLFVVRELVSFFSVISSGLSTVYSYSCKYQFHVKMN